MLKDVGHVAKIIGPTHNDLILKNLHYSPLYISYYYFANVHATVLFLLDETEEIKPKLRENWKKLSSNQEKLMERN